MKSINSQIHPSVKKGKYCIIGDDVYIGKNTIIGDFVTITNGTIINRDCYIGHYSILDNCSLEPNVKIQGRVRIGKGCVLEDHVEMKYNAILTENARIGHHSFIGVGAVTLGSDVDGKQIPGTDIGPNSYIGGQALIAPGLKIPNDTIVGANSYLRKVNGAGTYVGNPAKKIK